MRIKSERDFWSGLLFIVIGTGFAAGALNYGFGSSARPGPAYFPFGLGVMLALIGGLVLFKALTVETEGGDRIGPAAWKPLIVVLGTVGLFGLLLPVLVVIAALAGDEFHFGEALANAAILTLGSWGVFIKGQGLTLPLRPTVPGRVTGRPWNSSTSSRRASASPSRCRTCCTPSAAWCWAR